MKRLKKIKASAMQFAVLVSVIIALLLGSFLTLTHIQNIFKIQSKLVLKTLEATNLGIKYTLSSKNKIIDSISYKTENIETKIKTSFWGGFQKIESSGKIKEKEINKMTLIGNTVSIPNIGIFVSDHSLPLRLVGNTRIEGSAYVSNNGILPGKIGNQLYLGGKLIDGKVNVSQNTLPNLNSKWIEYIDNLLGFYPSNTDNITSINSENINTFFDKEKIIYSANELILYESYIGNIIIKSDKTIRVTKNANLQDVIIVAPKIIIEKGFTGNASFIAKEYIIVEENVLLKYPSALIVAQKRMNDDPYSNSPISISKNTEVKGNIVFLKDKESKKKVNTNIEVDVDLKTLSSVQGQVYCQGNTQISGTVVGSVYTERFITKGFGSKYVNYIYNGTILANDLHEKFCGLPFEEGNKGIVKWLY